MGRVLLRTDSEKQPFTFPQFTRLLILLMSLRVLKRVYLFYLCICMPASMYVHHVCASTHGSQKRAPDPLELEFFESFESPHVDVEH